MEHGFTDDSLRKNTNYKENHFKRLIKWKKDSWAVKTVEEAYPEDMWGFCKWSKGGQNYPTPAIKHSGHFPATTHTEKCKVLRKELYQPPPVLPDEYPINLTDSLLNDLPFQDVTDMEVEEAILDTSNTSASGFSQHSYRQVKWAFQTQHDILVALYRRCLYRGYHSKSWQYAIAVALCKPCKPDYSEPHAYRLITLLEYLGKVLEKIIVRHLQYMAATHSLIPCQQFGARAGYSTNNAVL